MTQNTQQDFIEIGPVMHCPPRALEAVRAAGGIANQNPISSGFNIQLPASARPFDPDRVSFPQWRLDLPNGEIGEWVGYDPKGQTFFVI